MLFYLTALVVVLLDQATKLWIRANLAIGETLFRVGFVRIIRIPPNPGGAFGIFQGYLSILTIVSAVMTVILLLSPVLFFRRISFLDNKFSRFVFGLILGGTVGNLIDRAQPALGGVTDFIDVGFWPTFNVADSAITIGMVFFIVYFFRLTLSGKI